MARARNLKPSFFTNDILAEIAPLGRILFQGLWCLADRAGRLEDRPKKIKAEVLPYDECDADAFLSELHEKGFILRYEMDGTRFIQVLAFTKHQNPHVKEAASSIPAPYEHSACTVQEEKIPEQAGLIPDSPLPIPSPAPPGVLDHVWDEWHKHRGKQTPVSIQRQRNKLAELQVLGNDPNAVILQSIERGWTGLFPLKVDKPAPRKEGVTPFDVDATAKRLNLSPRPGESMEQFVMRVRQTREAA